MPTSLGDLRKFMFGDFEHDAGDSHRVSPAQELIVMSPSLDETDLDNLKKTEDIWTKISNLRQEQLLYVKNRVQVTSEEEVAEEEKIASNNTIEDLTAKEVQLKEEKQQAQDHLENLMNKNEELKKIIRKIGAEQDALNAEYDKVCKDTTKSLPFARQKVKLYNTITNVRWHFDCEPHKIEGYVANKDNVKPFSLNSKQVSKFFIANYLWDLLEEDW